MKNEMLLKSDNFVSDCHRSAVVLVGVTLGERRTNPKTKKITVPFKAERTICNTCREDCEVVPA